MLRWASGIMLGALSLVAGNEFGVAGLSHLAHCNHCAARRGRGAAAKQQGREPFGVYDMRQGAQNGRVPLGLSKRTDLDQVKRVGADRTSESRDARGERPLGERGLSASGDEISDVRIEALCASTVHELPRHRSIKPWPPEPEDCLEPSISPELSDNRESGGASRKLAARLDDVERVEERGDRRCRAAANGHLRSKTRARGHANTPTHPPTHASPLKYIDIDILL